jgi:hypothetical protein
MSNVVGIYRLYRNRIMDKCASNEFFGNSMLETPTLLHILISDVVEPDYREPVFKSPFIEGWKITKTFLKQVLRKMLDTGRIEREEYWELLDDGYNKLEYAGTWWVIVE